MLRTEQESIERAEALYEKVKARLTEAEQAHIETLRQRREESQGRDRGNYGHDLSAAIRRAEFRAQQERAEQFLNEDCNGNVFAAFGRIVRATFDTTTETKSGETVEAMLRRALESELRELALEAKRDAQRRERGDFPHEKVSS